MTQEELEKQIEKAVAGFSSIPGVTEEVANMLVGEGYLSYDDLSVIEPDDLQEMGGLTEDQVQAIVDRAEELAEEAEHAGKHPAGSADAEGSGLPRNRTPRETPEVRESTDSDGGATPTEATPTEAPEDIVDQPPVVTSGESSQSPPEN
jgi:N utilization substance protein A